MSQQQFEEIIQIIKQSQANAMKAVNIELINLYWNVGAYINHRVETAEWKQSVVKELANYLQKK